MDLREKLPISKHLGLSQAARVLVPLEPGAPAPLVLVIAQPAGRQRPRWSLVGSPRASAEQVSSSRSWSGGRTQNSLPSGSNRTCQAHPLLRSGASVARHAPRAINRETSASRSRTRRSNVSGRPVLLS
jgi:hypothetical protein